MRLSQLFTKTFREPPKDELAVNAQLLERGGFVYKNSAGVYTFLPLGWRVVQKILVIIREEMDSIGGQEMFMPALIERKYLEPTGRWDVDIGYRVMNQFTKKNREIIEGESNFVLGWSHEDVLTALVSKYINSYKDLPFSVYQIQTKFRNEPRAKSGLLRGREFIMKDMYSFHTSEEDLFRFYGLVKDAYMQIFRRCGLKALYTLAAGGLFTIHNTHEFQVLTEVGEDTIFLCEQCDHAENKDISHAKDGDPCPKCGGSLFSKRGIEVGNIFPLGTKYSDALRLWFIDETGEKHSVVMGSYGIGIGRLMATVVEVHHDERGIVWPQSIAPFDAHLVVLDGKFSEAERIYDTLQKQRISVLYDDREDKTAGEKFVDADLIGCPVRIVVSEKTVCQNSVEMRKRTEEKAEFVAFTEVAAHIQ